MTKEPKGEQELNNNINNSNNLNNSLVFDRRLQKKMTTRLTSTTIDDVSPVVPPCGLNESKTDVIINFCLWPSAKDQGIT